MVCKRCQNSFFPLTLSSFTSTRTRSALQWLLEKPGHGGVRMETTPQVPCWHFNKSKKMASNCSVLSDASSVLRYWLYVPAGQQWLSVFLTSTSHVPIYLSASVPMTMLSCHTTFIQYVEEGTLNNYYVLIDYVEIYSRVSWRIAISLSYTYTPFPMDKKPIKHLAFDFSGKGYNRHSFRGQMTLQ